MQLWLYCCTCKFILGEIGLLYENIIEFCISISNCSKRFLTENKELLRLGSDADITDFHPLLEGTSQILKYLGQVIGALQAAKEGNSSSAKKAALDEAVVISPGFDEEQIPVDLEDVDWNE